MTILNSGINNYATLHFEWYLVDFCNYKCSYCNAIDKNVTTFSKETSPSKYKLVLQRLRMLKVAFEVDLYGGEPTLHPDFLFILDELSNMPNCKLVEIKTNLSRPLHFLKQIFKHPKIKLAASYHAEYYSEEFLKKCIALHDKNFYCHVNLSDKPNAWEKILNVLTEFDNNGVKYDLNILLSTSDYTVQYNDEFYRLFGDKIKNITDKNTYRFKYVNGETKHFSAFTAYKEDLVKFNGYKCQALLYDIDSDGSIVNCCTKKPLPFIVDESIFNSFSVCPSQRCHADMMLNFYKENSNV